MFTKKASAPSLAILELVSHYQQWIAEPGFRRKHHGEILTSDAIAGWLCLSR